MFTQNSVGSRTDVKTYSIYKEETMVFGDHLSLSLLIFKKVSNIYNGRQTVIIQLTYYFASGQVVCTL